MIKHIAVNSLHLLVTLYVLLGWLATDTRLLVFHALFVTAMISHWMTNRNRCFMNEVLYGNNDKEFVTKLINTFGIYLKNDDMVFIQYFCAALVLTLSLYRLMDKLNRSSA